MFQYLCANFIRHPTHPCTIHKYLSANLMISQQSISLKLKSEISKTDQEIDMTVYESSSLFDEKSKIVGKLITMIWRVFHLKYS